MISYHDLKINMFAGVVCYVPGARKGSVLPWDYNINPSDCRFVTCFIANKYNFTAKYMHQECRLPIGRYRPPTFPLP